MAHYLKRPQYFAFLVFLLGVAAAFLFLRIPETRALITGIQGSGYAGAFLAGVLYAISFAAASSTVIFAGLTGQLHPVLAAAIGGVGALLYDFLIFSVARRNSHSRIVEAIKARIPGRSRIPKWLTLVLGMVIIASPLPDELGSGLFGFTAIRARWFFVLSFLLNSAGILVIILLG